MADETVKVTLTANTKPYTSALDQAAASTTKVDKASQGMALSMVKGGAGMLGIASATTVAVGEMKSAVSAAINMQDSISKVGVIFGSASQDIIDFADDTTRSFGLTKTAALDAASTFAILGKSAGLTGDELTKFSTDLTQRAVDLKSFYGGSVQDAITAVGAALRGESEPIRAYGVLLDDATLRAKALEMGLISSVKEGLTPQTRALVAAAEVMEQTSQAAGDYARTQDGAANSINDFNVAYGRFKEEFGTTLLPIITQLAKAGEWVIDVYGKINDKFKEMGGGGLSGVAMIANILDKLGIGADDAADSTDNLGNAAAGAVGGIDALGASAGTTGTQVGEMKDEVKAAIDELNGLIDAQQGLLGAQRDLLGMEGRIRDSARQTGSASTAANTEAVKAIRERESAEEQAEINRARRRAQAKADAAADKAARGDTQAGVAGAIATDKAARAGKDIDGSKQRGTVGEATGTLSKAQQRKLDREIEGIRARHKKSTDAQIEALGGASKAADTYSYSLDKNTEAGRRNLDQLDAEVDGIQRVGDAAYGEAIRQGKSAEEAARIAGAAMLQARTDLVATYTSVGFARAEVESYLKKLGLIPKDIKTTFKLDVDTSAADAAAAKLARDWGPGPGKVWNPHLGAWSPGPGASSGSSGKTSGGGGGSWQTGGEIHGPGGPRSDSVPIWASAGEFMVNAHQYAANRDLVRAINAGNGPVSGGGFNVGTITVNETSGNRVRMSVIDALAESAYRSGAVR